MSIVNFGTKPFETELIIFDKDGTITDFKKTWMPVLEKRLEIILKNIKTGFHEEKIRVYTYHAFGIFNEYIDPYGPFPYSSPLEDEIIFTTVLYHFGISWQKAKEIARHAIDETERQLDRAKYAELFDGARETLEALRKEGIFIALATADLTSIAYETLKNVRIHDLFDYIIGADMVKNDKPNPDMIDKIVESLKVSKAKTVMVGDSITDMEMGKRANVGLVVGVLEGRVASKDDLLRIGDIIIDSIREIKVV